MVNLYRDPKGENIFKSIAPPTEMGPSKPPKKTLSRGILSTMSLNLESLEKPEEQNNLPTVCLFVNLEQGSRAI